MQHKGQGCIAAQGGEAMGINVISQLSVFKTMTLISINCHKNGSLCFLPVANG